MYISIYISLFKSISRSIYKDIDIYIHRKCIHNSVTQEDSELQQSGAGVLQHKHMLQHTHMPLLNTVPCLVYIYECVRMYMHMHL